MPFGIKEIPVPETTRINPYEAAEELLNLDQELYSDSSKNTRKRKKNGSITEFDEEDIEELVPLQDQHSSRISSSSCKKQKLDDSDSKKVTDEFPNAKAIKQNNKNKLRKKSDKLNISEPLPSKKLKNPSKKLNNTFSECTEESTVSADLGTSKGSTSCNWDIDVAESSTSLTTTPGKVSEKSKPSKKSKAKAEKEGEKNLLKTTVPWLTPVLTRLEEQSSVSKKSYSLLCMCLIPL